jgi:hypothetical protein
MGTSVAGPLAAGAPVALAARAVVVRPPGLDVLALAPGALERTLCPPEGLEVGWTVFGVEEWRDVGEPGQN